MAYFVLKLTQESPWGMFQWEVFAAMKSNSANNFYPKMSDCFLDEASVTYAHNAAIASPGSSGTVYIKLDPIRLYELVKSAYDKIHLPLIGVDFGSGLDGTTYTVEFSTDGFGSVQLIWWSSYPKEWQPLFEWWKEMTEFLNAAIKNKDA